MPYYIKHLLIALGISGLGYVLDGSAVLYGALFYLGREIRDREKLGFWDWKGLLYPAVPLTAFEVYLRLTQ